MPHPDAEGCELTNIEAQILLRLDRSSARGDQVRLALAADAADFDLAAAHLWSLYALQGRVEDGCCHDPCGPHCVSASVYERKWSLTDRGRALLQATHGNVSTP